MNSRWFQFRNLRFCMLDSFRPRAWDLKPRPNDSNMPMQHIATLLGATCCVRLATVLRCVATCWVLFDHGQIWANNTQQVATRWPNARNMLRPTMLRYVALACCDRLAGALKLPLHNISCGCRIIGVRFCSVISSSSSNSVYFPF